MKHDKHYSTTGTGHGTSSVESFNGLNELRTSTRPMLFEVELEYIVASMIFVTIQLTAVEKHCNSEMCHPNPEQQAECLIKTEHGKPNFSSFEASAWARRCVFGKVVNCMLS